jgi:hypothetical protein
MAEVFKDLSSSVDVIKEIFGNAPWIIFEESPPKLTMAPASGITVEAYFWGTGGVTANLTINRKTVNFKGLPVLPMNPELHKNFSFAGFVLVGIIIASKDVLGYLEQLLESSSKDAKYFATSPEELRKIARALIENYLRLVCYPAVKSLEIVVNEKLDTVRQEDAMTIISAVKGFYEFIGKDWEPKWV